MRLRSSLVGAVKMIIGDDDNDERAE